MNEQVYGLPLFHNSYWLNCRYHHHLRYSHELPKRDRGRPFMQSPYAIQKWHLYKKCGKSVFIYRQAWWAFSKILPNLNQVFKSCQCKLQATLAFCPRRFLYSKLSIEFDVIDYWHQYHYRCWTISSIDLVMFILVTEEWKALYNFLVKFSWNTWLQ